MASVGLFFGSDTGNTEHVAKMIQKELGKQLIEVHDIAKSSKEDIAEFDLLMFGIPTWYYGEASVTGMIFSRSWKKLTSPISWWPYSAAETRKTTPNISSMPWA